MNEIEWDRFAGGLLSYIQDYYNRFIDTNYSISIKMTVGEIQKELMEKTSIEELSSDLQKVVKEYLKRGR